MKKIAQKELDAIIASHEEWLKSGNGKRADLRDMDLSGLTVKNKNLELVDFENASFRDSELENLNLAFAKMTNTDFRGAYLKNITVTLEYGDDDRSWIGIKMDNQEEVDHQMENMNGEGLFLDLVGAAFDTARLKDCDLEGANINDASFDGAVLDNVSFDFSTLHNTSFVGSRIRNSHFEGEGLKHNDFSKAKLSKVIFNNTDIEDSGFDGAELTKVEFLDSTIEESSFTEAELHEVDFGTAKLKDVDFEYAKMNRTQVASEDSEKVSPATAVHGEKAVVYTNADDRVFKNLIPFIMKEKDVSIHWISERTGLSYPKMHAIARKAYLDDCAFGDIGRIGQVLGVEISRLYALEYIEIQLFESDGNDNDDYLENGERDILKSGLSSIYEAEEYIHNMKLEPKENTKTCKFMIFQKVCDNAYIKEEPELLKVIEIPAENFKK